MRDTMRGPEGSEILPLPVLIEDGMTASVWELDDDERRQLAEGGRIALAVYMHPTPPVALSVAAPYCEKCSEPMTWNERLQIYVCAEHEDGCAGCGEPIEPNSKVWVMGESMYHLHCKPVRGEANSSSRG